MAFCNRVGSLLRQNVFTNNALNGHVSMTSMLNVIRCMSSSKLFIGGLAYETDDQSLRDAFSAVGDVINARVITDRDTGRSRGFGFVCFSSEDAASLALSAMDGQKLNGRNIRVSYAQDRSPRNFGNPGGIHGGFGNTRASDGGS